MSNFLGHKWLCDEISAHLADAQHTDGTETERKNASWFMKTLHESHSRSEERQQAHV